MSKLPNQNLVKIGEAARRLGVSIDTLRRWEKVGKISSTRTPGGTRLYSLQELELIVPASATQTSTPVISDSKVEVSRTDKDGGFKAPEWMEMPSEDGSLKDDIKHPNISQSISTEPKVVKSPGRVGKIMSTAVLVSSLPVILTLVMFAFNLILPAKAQDFFASANVLPKLLSPFNSVATVFLGQSSGGAPPGESPADFSAIKLINPNNPRSSGDQAFLKGVKNVLAESTEGYFLEINSDTTIKGNLTAQNIIYSIKAGTNISITGEQDLTITADIPETLLRSDPDTTQTITATSASATGLSVAAPTSASVDIFNVTNNAGTTKYLTVSSGGNVGIGTSSPTTTLHVVGTGNITGATTLGGAVTASSTLKVSGSSTLSGAVTAGGSLEVSGASTLSGAVAASSSLVVTGATTLSSTLALTGAATLSSYIQLAQISAPSTTTNRLYNVSGDLVWNGINMTAGGALPVGTNTQTLYNASGTWTATSNFVNDGTDITTTGDLAVNGGDLTTTNTTATLFNTTATTLSLGGAATTALNLGNGSGNYTAINLGSGAGTHIINIAGTGATAADTINIGTGGTGADTIAIGSSASTTAVTLTAGTGNIALTGADGTTYTIGSTSTTGPITIGQSTATNTIAIGNANSTGTQTINIGAGTPSGAGLTTIAVGNSNASSTLALTGGDDWSMAATGVLTLSASAAATNAIVVTDTDYTNAISLADNNITGTTYSILATTSTLTLDAASSVQIDGDTSIIFQDGGTTYATFTQSGTQDLQIDAEGGDVIIAANDNLSLASGTGTFTQTFTGTTTDAMTITATSLSSGSALVITGPSSGTAGVTDASLKITSDVGNIGTSNGLISSTATIDSTGASANGVNVYLSTANSNSTNANTAYGVYNTISDAVALGNTIYGDYTTLSITGDVSATKTAYGTYSTVSNDNTTTDQGVRNTYGGYFSSTGSSRGTSTAYGIYAAATGADTNWAGYFAGNVTLSAGSDIFAQGAGSDIGSSSTRFANGYFDTLDATNLSGTVTGGSTTSSSWTINSDNATADTENASLAFERGTTTPNSIIEWDATNDEIDINSSINLTGTTSLTTQPLLALATATAHTTGDIVDITATYTPTAGGTQSAVDLNLTNSPSTNANTLRVVDIGLTDGGSLANTVYGIYADVTTSNSSDTTYAAYFGGGNVGIGDTTPSSLLEVGNGTDSLQVSSVGDMTFVDADGAASITGPAGGALTVAAGSARALTLTANLGSTWSTSDGLLTITGDDGLTLNATSTAGITGNVPDNLADAIDIQQGTNNYINVNTTNSSENVAFGNATTNPSFSFLGTGAVTIAGSADGTDALVLTAGDLLISNGDFDLSGGDFNVTLDAADTANLTGTAPASVAGNGTNAATNTLAVVGTAGGASSGTTGQTGGNGGAVALTGGIGGAVAGASGIGGVGGELSFIAGAGGNGAATGGVGGAVSITAGAAGTGGNASGGTLTLNSGALTGSGTSTINLGTSNSTVINIGDSTVTKTIDIGGVDSSAADTINLATNSTAADTIAIGNTHASTTLALTGGDDWSMAATGILTMSASASQTTAIVITDTDYTNSLSIGDNTITGTTANIDLTYFDVAGSTGAVTIDPQTTGTYLDFTLDTAWTFGTLINADFGAGTTQGAAAIAGMLLDLNTNLTAPAAGQNVTGYDIKLPVASTTSNTTVYTGFNLSTAGAITNGTAGSFAWRGANIAMPNITQNASGSVTSSGLLITTGTITTAGTQHGINLSAAGVGAGTLNGINIGGITASGGTETAINIGSGWDSDINATTSLEIAIGGSNELYLDADDFSPSTSDGNALGTASLMWADLFLASGSVVNFDNGDVTITHATDALTVAGGNLNANDGFDVDDAFVVANGGALTTSQLATFNGNLVANGDVDLGSDANDTLTLNAVVDSNLTFIKEVARTIQIADSTTSNTAGAALTIKGAAGAATNAAGGAINVTGGAGAGTGAGGALVYTAGASGSGATGNGGAISLTPGAALSTNGTGGGLTLTTGAGKGSGLSGAASLTTGSADSGTATGTTTVSTGNATSANSGALTLSTGTTTTSGTTGAISITTGNSAGTSGALSLDVGTGTAGTISLGATNGRTITIGSSSATGVSITDDNWSVTTSGAATFASGTFNGDIDMTNDLILNIGAAGTDFTTGGGLTLAELLTVNDDVDINLAAGENVNIAATAASTADMLVITNSGQTSTTDGVDGLQLTYGATNASGNVIDITPTYTTNVADTLNLIDFDAFTATADDSTAGSITATVRGLNIGNLTESVGAADIITSTGLNFGTGWDSDINATTSLEIAVGGTNELKLDSSVFSPATTDSSALGSTSLYWSDLFLASAGVVNFNNDITITHATDILAIEGGSVGIGETTPGDTLHVLGELTLGAGTTSVSNSISVLRLGAASTAASGQDISVNSSADRYGAEVRPTFETSGASDITTGTFGMYINNYTNLNFSQAASLTNAYGLYIDSGTYTDVGSYCPGGTCNITNTYGLYVEAPETEGGNAAVTAYFEGNVGIGDTTPASLFVVGDGEDFQVGSTGIVTAAANINANGGLDVDDAFVVADGGGTLTIADNFWVGLGSSSGRVEFDDQTTDEINFFGANVSVSNFTTITPSGLFQVGSAEHASSSVFDQSFTATGINSGLYVSPATKISGGGTVAAYSAAKLSPSIFVADDGTTLTGYYGLNIDFMGGATINQGTITNAYGLNIAPIDLEASTSLTNAWSLYVSEPDEGTNKYTAYFEGNVGIGDTTPASLFVVGDGEDFQVGSTGIVTAAANINANGGLDVDDAFVVADGGAVTANTDVDFTLAGGENVVLTNASNTTAAAGLLDINGTGSTSDSRTLDVSTTFTSTGATTSYGLSNTWASTAVVTGASVSQTAYGLYNTASKTGADDATGTYSLYGSYNTATNTGRTAAGTVNTYGGYFDATGDAAGTTSVYGLYVDNVSGGDTNVALCFDCDGTWTSSTVASGIQFGTDANAVNLYRSASDTLKTDDSLVVGTNYDQSGSSGTFATGTGTVSLNGTTTIAAGKSLSLAAGAGQFTQTGTSTDIKQTLSSWTKNSSDSKQVNFYIEQDAKTGSTAAQTIFSATSTNANSFLFQPFYGENTAMINSDGSVKISMPGTQTGFAVCHTTNGTIARNSPDELVDCTGTLSDYAERYPVAQNIGFGDIILAGNNYVNDKSGVRVPEMVKSSSAYQSVIGVTSDNYNDFSSIGDNYDSSINIKPVALVGRVPVKVTLENGPIIKGDFVTTSSTPGKAMRASRPGPVIGVALDDYTGQGDTVMVFVKATFADPNDVLSNLMLDSDGSLIIPEIKAEKIVVSGDVNVGGALKVSRDGIDSSNLVDVGQAITELEEDRDDLATNLNSLQSSVISLQMSTALFQMKESTNSAQLAVLGESVASQSAEIAEQDSAIATLTNDLSDIKLKLMSPESLLATGSATLANINISEKASVINLEALDATISATFKSLGDTFLGRTTIAGDLYQDGTFSITNGSTINAFPILKLQDSPLASLVDIFNGLVTIDNTGKLAVESLAVGSKTLDTVTIPAGSTKVTITTDQLTVKSKVFTSASKAVSVAVTRKDTVLGEFDIEISQPQLTELTVDWWIVEQK